MRILESQMALLMDTCAAQPAAIAAAVVKQMQAGGQSERQKDTPASERVSFSRASFAWDRGGRASSLLEA